MNALSNSNNVNPIRKSIIQAQLYGKRLISVVLTVAICLSILNILDYIYVNDCVSWERTIMNELSEQEDNIDLLYLGSSHVFTSVIPEKMDSIKEKTTLISYANSLGVQNLTKEMSIEEIKAAVVNGLENTNDI